jgi:sugar phosphate isomerase/epimerase
VDVLIENIPNSFSSAERLDAFLLETHLNLGFCFDLGHAHMNEGVGAAFEIMQGRIRSTHVHDNHGVSDEHLPPAPGAGFCIDWKKAMGLLRSRPGQYPLLLELTENPESPIPLHGVSRIFEELEAL